MEMKRNFPGIEIKRCNEFHRTIRDEFLLECPKEHLGCLTKFEAGSITRSCSKAAINDCRVDNGITYCYCKNDACNNPDRKLDDPAPDQLLGVFDSQKTHKIRGKRPSSGKLISIEAGLTDDEDMRIVHKNRKTIVHHSGRPDNDEEVDEGSGDYNYDDGEIYYSESDESNTLLMAAISDHLHPYTEVLLKAGARADLYSQERGLAPIHLAVKEGDEESNTLLMAAISDHLH